jgi:hypothetical protein
LSSVEEKFRVSRPDLSLRPEMIDESLRLHVPACEAKLQ